VLTRRELKKQHASKWRKIAIFLEDLRFDIVLLTESKFDQQVEYYKLETA